MTNTGEMGSVIRLKQFTEVTIWHQEITQLNSEVGYSDLGVPLSGCTSEQTHKSTKGPADLRVLEDVTELELLGT